MDNQTGEGLEAIRFKVHQKCEKKQSELLQLPKGMIIEALNNAHPQCCLFVEIEMFSY